MLDSCVGNEQWKFSMLHQVSEQESVLRPERSRIEHTGLDVYIPSSYRKSGSVQISNAAVGLKQLSLKRKEP